MPSTSDSDTANLDSVIVHTCGKSGYCDFRPSQNTAIKCFLQGRMFSLAYRPAAESRCREWKGLAWRAGIPKNSDRAIIVPAAIRE